MSNISSVGSNFEAVCNHPGCQQRNPKPLPVVPVFHIFLSDNPAQKKNDDNLMLIWPRIVRSLRSEGLAIDPAKMPRSTLEVKAWLIFNRDVIAKLKCLDLSHLGLTAIPREFLDLPFGCLQILNLGGNNLDEIPPRLLEKTPSLRLLFLNDNKFRSVPKELEAAAYRLHHLNLEGNRDLADHPFVRMRKVFEKAMASPAVKMLFEKALEQGPWTICIEHYDETFQGMCDFIDRKIFLKEGVSENAHLEALVFEIINASKMPEFERCAQKVARGELDRDNFAKEIERIEHGTGMLHHTIVEEAVARFGWDPEVDCFKDCIADFEEFWELAKNTPHADFNRQKWDNLPKPGLAVQGGNPHG